MLIELLDEPGTLEAALHVFSTANLNLTHIESRPAIQGRFDFYVDCEGERGDAHVEEVIHQLEAMAEKLLVLDTRHVPWFPRYIAELDAVAPHTLDAGSELTADHPGFSDARYRKRRAEIEALALNDRFGKKFPVAQYTEEENETWKGIYRQLRELHHRYACSAYLQAMHELELHCDYGETRIPQGRDVSAFLEARTGFRLRPVAGLLSARDFLNGLAFRVFFSTQYIRHHSKPDYTPEPDVCHELIGHAPMFADAAFADLSQEIGLASLGASDAEIERLARCYWHSVEFGLVRENDALKAYGAGLLSSPGELVYACESATPQRLNWDPECAAEQDFPITKFQPVYFVADSLQSGKELMEAFSRGLTRPFYARYNPTTHRIWVDRAVHREEPG
jgi:phenylalanine-4-hydroxylase